MDFTGFFEALRGLEDAQNEHPWVIIKVKTRESYLESYEALRKVYQL